MIYIRTAAYNAEKTLKRAVDSVLNQTYQNFEYHILEHGSTDRTRELVREYAKKDSRIIPYYNKVNRAYEENPDFWNLSKRIPEGNFFCVLDADDAYEPTFFEEMLRFMDENHLEIAACGTVFLDGASGKVLGTKVLRRNILVDTPEKMSKYFPMIHWNLRQVWGKLYSTRAAAARHETELPDWWPRAYGGDTVNVMECVKAVKSFGVYGKALHQYTVSRKSVSYKWIPGREKSDAVLHRKALELLTEFCGSVSERNLRFLYSVYFYAFRDTVQVLLDAQFSLSDMLDTLGSILENPVTREMLEADMAEFGVEDSKKHTLMRSLLQCLEILSDKYTSENVPRLLQIYREWNPDFEKLVRPSQLLWYMKNAPQIVSSLADGDYHAAANLLARVKMKEERLIFPVELAQTLAAIEQNSASYVHYSKLLIQLLTMNGDILRAEEELSSWELALPDDEELAALRRILSNQQRGDT